MYNHLPDTTTRKLRVFLCHASEDKPVVRTIYHTLKNYNIELWLDEKDLLPGQNWEELIPEVIRTCDIVLICLSRTFLLKEGYGHYEIRVVLEAAKRKPINTIYDIPYRLDDCEIPSYLGGIHYASLSIPEDFEKLIAAFEVRREWLNRTRSANIEPVRQLAADMPGPATRTIDQSSKKEHIDRVTASNPINVFLSYVHEDELLLRRLETHLSALKREGLISTWYDRQILPGANLAGTIDQHLEQASLILLLVSADFLASDYCYQIEVKRALELHQAGKAVVIPVVIRPTDWQKTPLAHLRALPTDGKAITDWSNQDEAFVNVVSGIRSIVEELASRPTTRPVTGNKPSPQVKPAERTTSSLPPQTTHASVVDRPGPDRLSSPTRRSSFGTPFPEVWNVPRRHNAFFTGRTFLLQQLADGFQVENGIENAPPQAIIGLAGMGKTQVAAEYAYRFRESYHTVLWVRAQTRASLVPDFQRIAGLLKLSEQILKDEEALIQAVHKWFRNEKDWLLIFDNADDFELVAPFIPVGSGHVLLTTRAGATVELAQPLELPSLHVEDGALCLLRRAGLLRWNQLMENAPSEQAQAARKLAEQMKGLPLALEQAGAYINDTRCGVIKYLDHYERYRAKLQQIQSGMVPDYAIPVAPALMMSSLMIGRTSAAFALLQLCAFLAPEGIPDEFITLTAPILGELLSSMANDPILLDQTIRPLVKYSLLEREEQSGSTLTTLSLHRILQLVLLDDMDAPTRQLWAERAVRALLLARETMPRSILQTHIQQCLDHIAQWKLSVPEAESLQTESKEI